MKEQTEQKVKKNIVYDVFFYTMSAILLIFAAAPPQSGVGRSGLCSSLSDRKRLRNGGDPPG